MNTNEFTHVNETIFSCLNVIEINSSTAMIPKEVYERHYGNFVGNYEINEEVKVGEEVDLDDTQSLTYPILDSIKTLPRDIPPVGAIRPLIPSTRGKTKGMKIIMNEQGIQQLLNRWRTRGNQFSKLSRMVKDVLAIQGSSVAFEATFSATRFQIEDHRYSLSENSLEISVLFRY